MKLDMAQALLLTLGLVSLAEVTLVHGGLIAWRGAGLSVFEALALLAAIGAVNAWLLPWVRRRLRSRGLVRVLTRGWILGSIASLFSGALLAGAFLLAVLERSGLDLVRANAIKMFVVTALTAVALPVFILNGQIAWLAAGTLAAGYSAGGALGARLALRGGERLIRWAMAVAVVALAGRMLGLYGTG